MASKPYRGHKDWHRSDKGVKPGHPREDGMATLQPGQHHTHFDSRGFHEDRGSNTRVERIHLAKANQHKESKLEVPINVNGGHDPRPEHYHKNSGLECGGHQLVRRGGSVIKGMKRGL